MDRETLTQIWPVFSAETREHLSSLSSGILELEDDPTRQKVLDGVRRTAHSMKGSAGSLGLTELEQLAHAIEGSLARFDPEEGLARATVTAALDAVEAIERALEAGDAGGEPEVPRLAEILAALGSGPTPSEVCGAAGPPGSEGPLALVERLELACSELLRPLDEAARRFRAGAAAEEGRALLALCPGSPLPARIAEGFARLAEGGTDGARVAAAVAGDLVDLRTLFERPAALAPAPPPAPVPPPNAERSVRVLSSSLDSLTRELELLSLSESRHRHRAGQVKEVEEAIRESVRSLERVGQALRAAQAEEASSDSSLVLERLKTQAARLSRLSREAARDADGQRLTGALLREDLRALRMVSASVALEPLRRVVREVAGRTGKEVDLSLSGGEVRLDRRVVDEVRDPLLHLVRNAVDHGIELPGVRERAGKPPRGQLGVKVELRGTRVGVTVEDDGAGLDVNAVRAAAVRGGVLGPEVAARMTDSEAAQLVFHPGLSTSASVTEISGRGVGLDVVKDTAERLQGTVSVSYELGRFTRFELEVPVSLSASAALLVKLGREVTAFPSDNVARVLLLREGEVGTLAGQATVRVDGVELPYASLSAVLGQAGSVSRVRGRLRPALLLSMGGKRVVLGVEEVLGRQELVVFSLGARLSGVPHLAGAAVLDDGRVIGVLAAGEIVRRVKPAGDSSARSVPPRPRVLVADDSLTTRSVVKSLLEIAGFAVVAAADGEEAWQLFTTVGAQVVVTDVQMPRLNGFDLTRRIKADPFLRQTPVVLITSLDSPEDRALGLEAGAEGYLVKREVERGQLLELVRQLVPERGAIPGSPA